MLCEPSRFSCSVSGLRLHVATAVRERFLYKNRQIIKQYKNKNKTRKKILKKTTILYVILEAFWRSTILAKCEWINKFNVFIVTGSKCVIEMLIERYALSSPQNHNSKGVWWSSWPIKLLLNITKSVKISLASFKKGNVEHMIIRRYQLSEK